MTGRRIDTTPSRTAEWTCASRAASSLESDSHYRCDDRIALLLVPTFLKILLRSPSFRRLLSPVMTPKGVYEYTIARTKYLDGVFREVLTQGFDQALIFGAGFDTRALRFQKEAENPLIFELDVPFTQKAKLDQYARRGLSIPANVTFIPVDFDRESLSEKLEKARFGRGAGACMYWKGW